MNKKRGDKATILLSMTKIEKEALQNLAKRSNVTVSELVRLALVYQAIDLPKAPLGNVGSLDKEEPRTNCIQVQVTDSEKLALRERAESLGCSMSDLVRRSAIQGKVVQQNEIDIEAVRRMTHELLKQGTNLNQLMYFLNANGIAAFDPAEVQQVIWNVRDAVRKATELTEIGIVDVSHNYPKMFVIRPQFFVPFIGILRNAALSSLKAKQELERMRQEDVDLATFEDKLDDLKGIAVNFYGKTHDKCESAKKSIGQAITKMESIQRDIDLIDSNSSKAKEKTEDLTIRIRVLRIEVLEVDPMVRVERIVELVAAALGNVNADAALCDLVAELSDVEVVGQVVHLVLHPILPKALYLSGAPIGVHPVPRLVSLGIKRLFQPDLLAGKALFAENTIKCPVGSFALNGSCTMLAHVQNLLDFALVRAYLFVDVAESRVLTGNGKLHALGKLNVFLDSRLVADVGKGLIVGGRVLSGFDFGQVLLHGLLILLDILGLYLQRVLNGYLRHVLLEVNSRLFHHIHCNGTVFKGIESECVRLGLAVLVEIWLEVRISAYKSADLATEPLVERCLKGSPDGIAHLIAEISHVASSFR